MTPPPWHVTDSAIRAYAYARRWIRAGVDYDSMPDEIMQRADTDLHELQAHATYRETDRRGREYWRGSKRLGGGLRWIIDPNALKPGELARVVWVGQGVPPDRIWTP